MTIGPAECPAGKTSNNQTIIKRDLYNLLRTQFGGARSFSYKLADTQSGDDSMIALGFYLLPCKVNFIIIPINKLADGYEFVAVGF